MGAGRSSLGPAASDFLYWLRRCEGFRVDSPHGRVGFVAELRFQSSSERPDAIAIRAGLFGRLLLIVPVEEIEEIFPTEERITLRHSPRLTGTERLRELARRRRARRPAGGESGEGREDPSPG